jgi:hypothetical protein
MFCAPCQVTRSPTRFLCMLQWNSFVLSPRKSTRRASQETAIINVAVWPVLRKRLHLKAYKLSIVQHLTDADKEVRKEFCFQMFHRINEDEKFLDSVIFSDESTFHVSCRIWGSENPRVSLEHVRHSPKVNVFGAHCKECTAPCSSWSRPLPVSCISWTCSKSSSFHS